MKRAILFLSMILLFALSMSVQAAEIYSENFNSGLGDWTAKDNNYDGYTWEQNNNSSWNFTGGSGGFAIADSYSSWADDWYDTLVSPIIDVTGMTDLTVSAQISYQHDTEGGYADVAYSTDNGATWKPIDEWTETYQGAASWNIDLDTGVTGFMLAFEYYQPEWSYYEYQVDDIVVEGSAVPLPVAVWLLGSGILGIMGLRKRGE